MKGCEVVNANVPCLEKNAMKRRMYYILGVSPDAGSNRGIMLCTTAFAKLNLVD